MKMRNVLNCFLIFSNETSIKILYKDLNIQYPNTDLRSVYIISDK